jgi:hypothetical protein
MDYKTCSSSSSSIATVVVPAGIDTPCKPQPQEEVLSLADQHPLHYFLVALTQLVLACSRAAALALATYTFALTAWRARRDPGDLAFVAGAYAALAALLLCLRRAERLAPPGTQPAAEERRRLHATVWALSAALSCAFAYRVSRLLPAALVGVVWCMTSFVVILGFIMLVLPDSEDQQWYGSADGVDCDSAAAGDEEPLLKKNRPIDDEMV